MKAIRAIPVVVAFFVAMVAPRAATAQFWMRPSVDLATTHVANGVENSNGHILALNSATVSAVVFGPVPYVSVLLGGSFERYTEQDPFIVTCPIGVACDIRFPNFNGLMAIAGIHVEPLPGLAFAVQGGAGACTVTNVGAGSPSDCSRLRVLRGDITIQPFEHLDLGIRWERLDDDNIAGNPFLVRSRMLLLRIH